MVRVGAFRKWRQRAENDFGLGNVQFVQADEYIWIANMIGQHGMTISAGKLPIRYEAVELCLDKVGAKARELEASVHMPRIGCGLAGGKWELIEPLITKTLCDKDVAVMVYDF